MSKTEADSLKKINTKFLKDRKYFTGHKGGVINWTSGWSDIKSSVGIQVSTLENYLRIYYTQTDNSSGEKKQFDYKIPLTSTPCNYGGKRYWFTCPMFKGGIYCGKRVNTLYKDGDYFACRHCYNLTYSSRNLSGISKKFGNTCLVDVEKARDQVKRIRYNGRYTKNYNRYVKLSSKFDNALIGMSIYLTKKSIK
jgi:hypothetical protein